MRFWMVVMVAVFAFGCGGRDDGEADSGPTNGPAQGHCDSRSINTACTEHNSGFDSATLTLLEENCTTSGGTWTLGIGCPRTGAAGGCQLESSGLIETQWLYEGDAATIESDCTSGGGVFVAP